MAVKLSVAEFAKYIGVKTPAVERAIRDGRISLLKDEQGSSYLDRDISAAQWNANTDKAKSRRVVNAADMDQFKAEVEKSQMVRMDYDDARAKRESYQAELVKVKLEEKQGTLVNAADVQAESFKIARQVRDIILSLPDRISAELAAETNQFTVHRRLSEEIKKCLTSLKGLIDESQES